MSNALQIQTPKELLNYLEKAKKSVAMALPKHLNPDRMLRLAVTCFSQTPKLRQCSPDSILASVIVASQIGLEPGITGQGYLIPYKQRCTFVPGWQGLVGLLNNSGRATAWTGAVFEGDEWDFQLGSAPVCRHVPGPNFGDAEKMTWVYAVGKVNGSECPVIEAWPMSRVWKHRDRFNKVGGDHYSFVHPEMYARKIVLLQVLKYMPRSIELQNAIAASDAAEMGNTSRVDDGGIVVAVESEVSKSDAPTEKPEDQVPGAEVPPLATAIAEAHPGQVQVVSAPAANSAQGEQTPIQRDVKLLRMLLKQSGFTEGHLLNLWRDNGLDESLASIGEVAEMKPAFIRAAVEPWKNTLEGLKLAAQGGAK